MSDLFIGLTMLVTLSYPPGHQLRGKVSSVVAGKSLTLRNVYSITNGKAIDEITIPATDIQDLVEAIDENVAPVPQLPAKQAVSKPRTFEDPAILSVGRRPGSSQAPTPSPLPPVQLPASRHNSLRHESPTKDLPVPILPKPAPVLPEIAVELRASMHGLEVGDGADNGVDHESEAEIAVPGVKRRRARRKTRKGGDAAEAKDLAKSPLPATATVRGPGWRQTPLLEPNPSFQPFSSLKNQRGRTANFADNGWQTEDATDVQDMGEFDFAANLSKFDKKTIFDGIRTEDEIADEDRLVGHNRLPKPGTAGGKNLHYTENVLDGPHDNILSSEDSELEIEAVSRRDTGSGRNSRRAESRLRKPATRKNSSVPSASRAPEAPAIAVTPKSAFYLVPANRRCEVVSPLQMLNLENIVDSECGLTEDMMTENAARGITEVALSALGIGSSASHLTRDQTAGIPQVIVYAGNNKSGLRAIAAARHLRNHNVNAIAVVLGIEREAELLDGLRRQLKVFRSFSGKVLKKPELMEFLKNLNAPVDLIIDGLLGLTLSFEELRIGDQATAYELIELANRSKAPALAIDIPTGIEPTTGKVSIIDGKPLYIKARYVVALGAPKKGLLQAMIQGEGVDVANPWQVFVVDIGIASTAWKKAGTRMRRGVEFEGAWTVPMRFQKGAD